MRYSSASSFRMALEARINARSAGSGTEVLRLRRSVAFERFLVRLAADDPGLWVLKGGTALEVRFGQLARPTQDVDVAFAGPSAADVAVDRVLDALSEDPHGDLFTFDVTDRRTLSVEEHRGAVIRLSVSAFLDGRVFERFVVDLVSAEGVPIPADFIEIGSQLEFADLPTVELSVLGLNAHFSEKLDAFCRQFEGRANTRVKDLVDLVLLIDDGLPPSTELVETVRTTFADRGRPEPSAELPPVPELWSEPFTEMAASVRLSVTDVTAAHAVVQSFWGQALAAALPIESAPTTDD
jgi:predicted nucleotidyltransferase component of viral defense system